MRILSLDPGVTTGVAVMEGETWLFGATVPMASLDSTFFTYLADYFKPQVVLIEEPPHLFRHELSAEVYYHIVDWAEEREITLFRINPGQWKGMAPSFRISSQHQADAATMARWFLKSQAYRDIVGGGLFDHE